MRIDRPTSQGTAPARRKERSQGAGSGDFESRVREGGQDGGGGVAGTGGIGQLDALLALQEVPDAVAQRSKARQHGQRMLDRLEELRLNLLDGRLSPAIVSRLADEVESARAETDDPALNEVLDEIELRARVELAKMGH